MCLLSTNNTEEALFGITFFSSETCVLHRCQNIHEKNEYSHFDLHPNITDDTSQA